MLAGEKKFSRQCSLKISPSGDSVKSQKSLSKGSRASQKHLSLGLKSGRDSLQGKDECSDENSPLPKNFIYEGKKSISRSNSGKMVGGHLSADTSPRNSGSPTGKSTNKGTLAGDGKLGFTDSGRKVSAFANANVGKRSMM